MTTLLNLEILKTETVKVDVRDSVNFPSDIIYVNFNEEIKDGDITLVIDGVVDVYNGVIQDSELTHDSITTELYLNDDSVFLSKDDKQNILENLTFEAI